MGSNSSSGSSGGAGPAGRKTSGTYGTVSDARKTSERYEFENAGAKKIAKGIKTPSLALNAAAAILSKPLQAGSKATRNYFKQEVLGKGAYKGTSRQKFETMSRSAQESMYKDYITGRNSGETDAYGRTINQSDNGGATSSGMVVQAPKVSGPTEAEVSQVAPEVTAEEARAKANDLIAKKRRGRGRSMLIATSPQGVTDKSLTLSNKSLLG